jgi:hypothetical protein
VERDRRDSESARTHRQQALELGARLLPFAGVMWRRNSA